MKASVLIKLLKNMIKDHGDHEVVVGKDSNKNAAARCCGVSLECWDKSSLSKWTGFIQEDGAVPNVILLWPGA